MSNMPRGFDRWLTTPPEDAPAPHEHGINALVAEVVLRLREMGYTQKQIDELANGISDEFIEMDYQNDDEATLR